MPELSPSLYRAGDGEQLVLLHGFTGTWRHWRPLLGDLVTRFEVIAPTLAGHAGGPPFPNDRPLTLAAAADSLESHLDELGVERAHLVGNSMGGTLAIELASRGRARSVVALSPGAGWWPHSGEAQRVARFFARQTRRLRALQSQLERIMRTPRSRCLALRDVMRHGELVSAGEAVAMARSAIGCQIIEQVLGALRRGSDVLPQELERIEVPVLLAWAERDRILPFSTCSPRFRAEIPAAELRVLRGVGHLPMWDDTALVTDTIVEWVAGQRAPGALPAQHAQIATT
jgi:pimeloyl-ACP methyl ester carboxylesterase